MKSTLKPWASNRHFMPSFLQVGKAIKLVGNDLWVCGEGAIALWI